MSWIYKGKVFKEENIPEGAYGYIYKLSFKSGENYFGKKCFSYRKKKRISKKVIKETKTRKRVEVQQVSSGWQSYTGSSKEFNELIKIKGVKNLKKEILSFHFNKSQLSLAEVKAIICNEEWLDEKNYNKWFSARIYKNQLK